MKQRYKKLILLYLFFLFLPVSNLPSAKADLTYYPILEKALNVSLKPITTRDSGFAIEKSETAITSFINNGIYGQLITPLGESAESNEIVYYADVEATVIFNVISFFDVDDADANGRTNYDSRDTLWLHLMTSSNHWIWDEDSHHYYYAHTREFMFDYTPIKLSGVDLEVTYTPLNTKYLSFLGRNISASIPPTDAFFEGVVAGSSVSGELAHYDDRFVNIADEVKMEANDFRESSDELPAGIGGKGNGDLESHLETVQVGVYPQSIQTLNYQPDWIKKLTSGDDVVTSEEGRNLKAILPIKLNPRIDYYNQYVKVRQLDHISILTIDNIFLFQTAGIYHFDPVREKQIYKTGRVVGVHINNYYIQQEVKISFTLFSTLQLDVPITQAVLDIPEIQRGDFVWDLAITGETGVTIVIHDAPVGLDAIFDGLTDIIGWIVGLAILGVSIFMVIKILPLVTKGISMKQDSQAQKRRVSKQ